MATSSSIDPSKMTAIFDLDRIAFKVAAAGEKRAISVYLKKDCGLGREGELLGDFPTRTKFWGSKRSRDGGALAQFNKDLEEKCTWEDFEIVDRRFPGPLKNVLYSAKSMIKKDLKAAGTTRVKFFIGLEESYRRDKSTLMEYKGNRKDTVKPVLFPDVVDFLIKTYRPVKVYGVETDDAITEAAYKRKDRFVITNDKDAYSQPTMVFNPDRAEEGIINCDCFGKLYLNDKKEVKGYGRKFLYWQMLFGDVVDNYRAACHSSKSFGEMSAYKVLVDCQTDKGCLEAMIETMKTLYPEEKEITTWKGDVITIDWLYVMNEMMQMARMRRFKGDEMHIKAILDKLNIDY